MGLDKETQTILGLKHQEDRFIIDHEKSRRDVELTHYLSICDGSFQEEVDGGVAGVGSLQVNT